MRLRTIFGFERFMATKKSSKKTAPVEEKAVPEEEVKKAVPKEEVKKAAPKAKAMKVGLEHLPDADTWGDDTAGFITASYHAMLGRDPTEKEMEHHTRTVERHKRPRADIQTDIRNGGEYQTLHPLVPANE